MYEHLTEEEKKWGRELTEKTGINHHSARVQLILESLSTERGKNARLEKKIKKLKKKISNLEHKIENPNMGYAYKAGGSYE